MAKLVTIRFEDNVDGDLFVDKLTNKGWAVGVVNGDSKHELGTLGEPDRDAPDMPVIIIGPTSVLTIEDAPDNLDHPYWAEKAASQEA